MSEDSVPIPVEKSTLKINITIKKPGIEIVAEGEIKDIYENINAISILVDNLIEELGTDELEIEDSGDIVESDTSTTADIPAISPGTGIKDNVEKLFATTWGKTPRSVSDTLKALEVNAVYTEYAQTATALRRLVTQGILRRVKRNGKWVYYTIPGRE